MIPMTSGNDFGVFMFAAFGVKSIPVAIAVIFTHSLIEPLKLFFFSIKNKNLFIKVFLTIIF